MKSDELNNGILFHNEKFLCRQCIDSGGCNDSFCLSGDCPERIPQPQYPSPNTALNMEELEELKACMEEVNELLQTLGNPVNEQNQPALQKKLRGLRGRFIAAHVKCGSEQRSVSGGLSAVGRNFIEVDDFEKKSIIPFHHLQTIEHDEMIKEPMQQPFLTAEKCLRRELVLHFSEVVSKSPFLVNVFFGLPLSLFLNPLLNKRIVLFFEKGDRAEKAGGTLTDLSVDSLTLKRGRQNKEINFADICLIQY